MNTYPDTSPVLISGMGRSGTTWVGDLLNYDKSYRVLFEPFFPGRVQEANSFNYIQYLNPQTKNAHLEDQARMILKGELRNNWVDREKEEIQNTSILVKEIRVNLMLGWLKRVFPQLKIILLVRHPLQVVHSWLRMGWGRSPQGKQRDIDLILSQESLLQDYPLIDDLINLVNLDDYFESVVFQWCLFSFVPHKQLKRSESHALHYEDLILQPYRTISDLFRYLERPLHDKKILKIISRPSHTNYLRRDHNKDKENLLWGWRTEFTSQQINKARSIIEAFGLGKLYDDEGIPTGSDFFCC